jgi:hypothetical protein
MSYKIIGIDPGRLGAIAELDLEARHCRWMKLPYRDDKLLNIREIKFHFDLHSANRIAVEKVGFIKGASGQSTFTFGMNFGMLMMLIADYPYEYIPPQVWHKSINGGSKIGTTKERTAASFTRINPSFGKIVMNQHEGLIDAFCLGYYCGQKNHLVMPSGFSFQEVSRS